MTSDDIDCGAQPATVTPLAAPDAMFRRLVECAVQGIGWADLDGNVIYMNPALREMLDLAPEAEVNGLSLRRFRPPEAGPVAGEMLRIAREQGSWSGELPLLSEQGRVIPTRHDIHLLRDDAGVPIAIACSITDLSQQKQQEQKLQRSKSKYRALVENIPQRVFYKDLQSRYLAVNRHFAADLGVAPQDIVGRDDHAFHPVELAERFEQGDRRVMESGRVEEFEESFVRDGREYIIHTVKTPVRGDSGEVVGVCGIFSDVTEQCRLEEQLQESEATLRAIYENAREGILVASVESRRLIMANPAICRMLGYSEAELLTMTPMDLHPPEALPRVREHFLAMEQGDFSLHQEIPFLRKDNSVFYADVSPTFLLIQGKPCFLGVFRDVTERRLVLAQLRDERNFSGAVLDNAGALVVVLDRGGRIRRFNRACEALSGYTFAEVEGRRAWDFLLLPEERDSVREHVLLALNDHPEELARKYTNYWLDKSGGRHLLEWHKAPLLDDQGRLEYLVSIGIDITEKQAVEDALRRSEETYARAEAIAHLGSWDWDIATGVLRWTDEIFRIFGQTPQSFGATYQAFLEAIHPDDRQQVIDAVNASVADASVPYSVEHRVIRPDGEIRSVQERGQVYRDERGMPVRMIGSVHDITEQKAAEAELARYREHLEELVRERTAEVEGASRRNAIIVGAAMDGFFSAGLDGRVNDCNEAYCRMLGYSREELLRLHIADIEADETPEEMAAHARKICEQGRDRFDTRHRRKDGGRVHVEVNVTLEEIAGEPLFFAFVHDITERKQSEISLTQAKEEAERANRAKSEFLSRMSHELRTPLNAILGFGQLLERDAAHPLTRMQLENVGEILHGGRHLLNMINEVLDLARVESGKLSVSMEPVSIAPILRECLSLAGPLAEARGIRLIEPVSPDCGATVLADRTRLKQVLLNLLSNAVKYNRAGGSVSIACIREGDAVRLGVSDTGPGLTPEQRAVLFMPFERLGADKGSIEGTGIGLALSKRLTELMQGEIGVESEPGRGSTFWVRLSVAAAESSASGAGEETADADSTRQWTLLYIEDNPANLRLMARILSKREGVRLIAAERPGIGLELAIAHRPDLILVDINLPDMDGFEVLRGLRDHAETRATPVIGISANAMPKDIERARAAGFADCLTKPLDINSLLAAVDVHLADLPGKSPI